MLRRLCYPGWNTVHVFVVPVVLMLILTQREPGMPESNPWLFYDVLLTCACTLFPTAIIQAHPGRSIDRFVGRYVLIGCLMCAYSIIFIAMTAGREYELEVTPAVFFGSVVTPMSSVMMGQRQYITSILSDGGDSHSIYLVGACVSIVWYLVILLKAMLVNARVAAAEAIAKGKASVSSHSDWQAMQSRPPGP